MSSAEKHGAGDLREKKLAKKCGIVMPISAFDEYSRDHWNEVLGIIREAVEAVGFTPNPVSQAREVGVIHKRIVQNLHTNEMVVCDVSGKNANVMFELGMRLAFDKPTVIVKDDVTDFSFDTSIIEHIEYSRQLRYNQIGQFKKELGERVAATYELSLKDQHHSFFLKHFLQPVPAFTQPEEIPAQEYIIRSLDDVERRLEELASFEMNAWTKRRLRFIDFSDSDDPRVITELHQRDFQHMQDHVLKKLVRSAVRSFINAYPKRNDEDFSDFSERIASRTLKFFQTPMDGYPGIHYLWGRISRAAREAVVSLSPPELLEGVPDRSVLFAGPGDETEQAAE